MTKQEARDILQEYIDSNAGMGIKLPIFDENIYNIDKLESDKVFESWSFRGLLKIAYDLKDK